MATRDDGGGGGGGGGERAGEATDAATPTAPPVPASWSEQGRRRARDARVLLVPVDGGATAETAMVLRWVAENVHRPGDRVHVLHVVPPSSWRRQDAAAEWTVALTTGISASSPDGVSEDESAAAWLDAAEERLVRDVRPALASFGVPPEDVEVDVAAADVSCASVGELVCDVARDVGAAMVIMAKHGKGALREALIGSTTNHVVRNCRTCPAAVLNAAPELTRKQLQDEEMKETEDPAFL